MNGHESKSANNVKAAPTRRLLLRGVAVGFAAVQVPFVVKVFAGPNVLAPCAPGDRTCLERSRAKDASDAAREFLNRGDAALAVGDMPSARDFWQLAIDTGKETGAQASLVAQQRLQMYTLTCNMTRDSIAAISRNYQTLKGDLIHTHVLQRALKALGHYSGPIDGELNAITRSAIRKFQRIMAFDETDVLAPHQIVYLICNAAETARDRDAQNTLGIMYAAGLGVQQNMEFALEWLRTSSNRGCADATYNLAILYGTGIILSSYRICDFPYSPEQADQYLKEACEQKHLIALALTKLYGKGSKYAKLGSRERWKLIEKHQLEQSRADKTGVYHNRLANLGTKCGPDKTIR
jgi:Putative peptidoglycan binding domain